MSSPSQKAAQTIHQIKHDLTAEQRLQGWQQARLQQGLSGEFALSAHSWAKTRQRKSKFAGLRICTGANRVRLREIQRAGCFFNPTQSRTIAVFLP